MSHRSVIHLIVFAALVSAALPVCAETPPRAAVVRLVVDQAPPVSVPSEAAGDRHSGQLTIDPPLQAGIRRLPAVRSDWRPGGETDDAAPLETLIQAWAIAGSVDQQLAAKRWTASSSKQSAKSARAQRWPMVGLESAYNLKSDEPSFRIASAAIPLPVNSFPYAQDESFSCRAKIDIPLYTSGRIYHGIDAADARVVAAALDIKDSTIDLKMQVAEEYIGVLRARRELKVTESTVRSLQSHARDVEMLFRHRQVPRNDLLAARVKLLDARQRAIQASQAVDSSCATYNRRLGRPLTSPVRIAELPLESVTEDVDALTARAVRQRPGIARLAAQADSLRHRAANVRARSQPQVALQGEYAFEENQFQSPNGIVGLGVGVRWNVYDGGRRRYEAAALMQEAEAVARTRADLKSWIGLQVRRAWLEIQETRQRLEVTAEAIEQAEENLRVARRRYALSVGTNTEVLDAERSRSESFRNHDNATYDAVLAVLRLRHATGGL